MHAESNKPAGRKLLAALTAAGHSEADFMTNVATKRALSAKNLAALTAAGHSKVDFMTNVAGEGGH